MAQRRYDEAEALLRNLPSESREEGEISHLLAGNWTTGARVTPSLKGTFRDMKKAFAKSHLIHHIALDATHDVLDFANSAGPSHDRAVRGQRNPSSDPVPRLKASRAPRRVCGDQFRLATTDDPPHGHEMHCIDDLVLEKYAHVSNMANAPAWC
jgi:hypothetical protein